MWGMDIHYQTSSSGDEKISIRIGFEPPLSGYEEVKPRLLSTKADAEEALQMVTANPTNSKVPAGSPIRFPRSLPRG
jgi:hypothetical protein